MFTGIVAGTGQILEVETDADGRRLRIESDELAEAGPGQSISVSGVCLTVERTEGIAVEVFVATETVDRTYLGTLEAGDLVNVELPLRADARLDGHFVQGHVDGTAPVRSIESVGEDWRFEFGVPADLAPYIVEKGSIALDGISLTVADLDEERGLFDVAIIPETYERTTLSDKAPGDPVHVEVDLLAKYVERLLSTGPDLVD